MKCDKCKHLRTYTLGQDECGAGSTVQGCMKYHWENCPYPFEDSDDTYWDDCKDFRNRPEPEPTSLAEAHGQ